MSTSIYHSGGDTHRNRHQINLQQTQEHISWHPSSIGVYIKVSTRKHTDPYVKEVILQPKIEIKLEK